MRYGDVVEHAGRAGQAQNKVDGDLRLYGLCVSRRK